MPQPYLWNMKANIEAAKWVCLLPLTVHNIQFFKVLACHFLLLDTLALNSRKCLSACHFLLLDTLALNS